MSSSESQIEAFNNSKIQEKEATELKRQELENKLLDFEANQTNTTSNTEQEEDEEGDFSKTNVALSFLQKMTVEQIFAEFDTDGSGLIDLEEFKNMLPTLGIKLSEAKALKYFKVCDVDGSGQIDIDEFRTALFACDPVSGNFATYLFIAFKHLSFVSTRSQRKLSLIVDIIM